jgi:hypothetical protein
MTSWYQSIYKAFIISAIISFVIGFFSEGKVSLGSYITGYSVLILAIMMILLILFNSTMKITEGNPNDFSYFNKIYNIVLFSSAFGPFLLMLVVIAFILSLMITYKSIILQGHVANGYHSFSNINVILILIQLYIVYTNITSDSFEKTGKMSKVTSSIIYLLGVLSAISSIILYTILRYFTTDGFTSK